MEDRDMQTFHCHVRPHTCLCTYMRVCVWSRTLYILRSFLLPLSLLSLSFVTRLLVVALCIRLASLLSHHHPAICSIPPRTPLEELVSVYSYIYSFVVFLKTLFF